MPGSDESHPVKVLEGLEAVRRRPGMFVRDIDAADLGTRLVGRAARALWRAASCGSESRSQSEMALRSDWRSHLVSWPYGRRRAESAYRRGPRQAQSCEIS